MVLRSIGIKGMPATSSAMRFGHFLTEMGDAVLSSMEYVLTLTRVDARRRESGLGSASYRSLTCSEQRP
jgi:hypothetical protein